MDATKVSRQQLTRELELLRARVAELEQGDTRHALAEEERCKWEHIFEHAGWGIVISSADGTTIEMTNPAFARMHGYTTDELQGHPMAEVFAPESRSDLPAQIQLAHERGHYVFEATHVRKDGTTFPVMVHITAAMNADGCVRCRAVHVEDITERKQEEALLRAQRKLVILLGLTSDLSEGLGYLVEATCQIEGIDCASVFLLDKQTGAFDLVSNRGLSPEFVKGSFHFNANTPLAHLAMAGWSIFWSTEDTVPEEQEALRRNEGLRALAMIPVLHGGQVVAMLNPGSRMCDNIDSTRHTLGAIAAQIGEFIGRTRTEEALDDSLSALQSLFDTAGDFLVILDEKATILRVNRVARKRLGYLLERELVGLPILKVYPPDRQQEARVTITDMMVEKAFACHIPLITKDGNLIPVEMRLVEGRQDNRDVFFALFRDITERRQTENALYESDEKYRTLFETLSRGIIYQDADGHIVSANPAAANILGLTVQQMQGRTSTDPHWRVVHEDGSDFSGDTHPALIALRTRTAVRDVVMGVLSPRDEEWRWLKVDAIPLFRPDEDGPFQVYTAFDDITERRRAEMALRQSEELLKKSQEIAHLGSWELDLINNRLTWSDEVYRIFGLEPQEFGATYEAFLEAVHSDDREAVHGAYFSSLREGQDCYEIEHRILKNPPGEVRYVHEKCEHVRDSSGKIVRSVGMVHDITERRRAEEALRASNAELQSRSDELNAFGHTVAHDLKNPLSNIIGFTCLMEDTDHPPTDEEMSQLVQAVKQLGLKMDSIIEEMMLLAGLRKEIVNMEPLDMGTIMTEILWRLAPLIDQSRAEIVCPPRWPKATGHAPWVEEVWINYITNAVKYGGCPPRVELGATMQDNIVQFWVHDNGHGLTPEEQTHLFTPFERLDQIHVSGHGLGLSIVRRIVERMDGQVGVESPGIPDQGSTFSFTLPSA